MGRVLTNNTALQYAQESAIGVLPGSPVWKLLEPNSINAFGSEITTTPRSPISKTRQRRKGTTTDLDSSVEYEADATMDSIRDFMEAFVFATVQSGTIIVRLKSGVDSLAAVNTGNKFTHSALSAALAEGTLLKTRGFTTAGNNGYHRVTSGGDTTNTPVIGSGLSDETPNTQANAHLEVCGFRFTDLTWTDTTKTIGSAGTDLTTLGLSVGQFVRVGDGTDDFGNGAAYGRIVSIAAGAIVLDKVTNVGTGTLSGGGDESADTVAVLYGQFIKNVATDDSAYVERSFHVEASYPDLGGAGTPKYEYAKGNMCNQMALALPLSDKAGINFGFVGTDTELPTTSRKSGANAPQNPVGTEALNTSADIVRLRVTKIDETGLTTDFKNVTLTLGNNVSPEKVLGVLGARYMNAGNFDVDLEGEIVFTESAVIDAIRNNETVTMELGIENDDGGVWFDLPAMTLGNGARSFPVNESVLASLSGQAFSDPTLGTSIGVSFFPHLPAA